MIQVRYGMFETNSSSTHSIFIVTEEEYENLEKGELLINIGGRWRGDPDTITKEKAIDELISQIYQSLQILDRKINDFI